MKSTKKVKPEAEPRKSPDDIIKELIGQRKLQQEALTKIKVSMDRKTKEGNRKGDRPVSKNQQL